MSNYHKNHENNATSKRDKEDFEINIFRSLGNFLKGCNERLALKIAGMKMRDGYYKRLYGRKPNQRKRRLMERRMRG